jgi:transcriptional regulator with XRE-family HTH domain
VTDNSEIEDLRAITDPVRRARRATEIIEARTALISAASAVRQEALELLRATMTQAEIAKGTGLTRARVSQLLGSSRPDRALLAPEAGPLTIAVVQKQAPDSGQPVLASVTRRALDALTGAARELGITTTEEEVPPPGFIDLNRSNLAVMIGPRISALIGQALSADPVIRWGQDRRKHWYITDVRTGEEYHSDFDEGWQRAPDGERACFAHIGRVRRPDGHGTFLYLAGPHSPGTAGAVAFFIREMPEIWEQVRRSPLWSAVVRTIADDDGTPVSSELVTPVYTHGKP